MANPHVDIGYGLGRTSVISLPGKDCYTLVSGVFLVRSLKVGAQDGITAMRTEEDCKGKASLSYVGGAKVPDIEFPMESVR
ncbi:hypothetical protein [Archangium lansingense]|uniref:Uncharacterized protein n=1 Tax=Archangium lansingense TaxID=2995310 RepID=A0ABT4AAX5_9BACT|nr:hypothetical protein [Archangium lansinium]MCY1078825.1 hypothetical protein [Archangium lansinium]